MKKKELNKIEAENLDHINDNMAGEEMSLTLDISGAQVVINANSGQTFIKVFELLKKVLEDDKK